MVERAPSGFTKAWVVLPQGDEDRWDLIAHTFASFSSDFSYTGLRGGGAIAGEDVDRFALALYGALCK